METIKLAFLGAIGEFFVSMLALVVSLLGYIISIAAWLVGEILRLNTGVVGQSIVRNGFAQMLSIANLAFVMGMVVIAIMTIIRSQTYGAKQLLWKIVVMAVMVNFGLAIAGSIVGFADGLTQAWLGQIEGGTVGNFGERITAQLKTHQAFIPECDPTKPECQAKTKVVRDDADKKSGGILDWLTVILAMLVIIFVLMGTIISLGVLLVMLLSRYVHLAILLILLPVAWVSWVFPISKGNWTKWWDTFLKQTFFAPIVVFFLVLVMKVEVLTAVVGENSAISVAASGLGPFYPLLSLALNSVVLVALMLGGMVAAQKFGAKFADAAIGGVTGMAKGIGSYVGNRARGRVAESLTREKPLERKMATSGPGRLLNPFRKVGNAISRATFPATSRIGGLVQGTRFEPAIANTGVKYGPSARERIRQFRAMAKSMRGLDPNDPTRGLRRRDLVSQANSMGKGPVVSVIGGAAEGMGIWKPEKEAKGMTYQAGRKKGFTSKQLSDMGIFPTAEEERIWEERDKKTTNEGGAEPVKPGANDKPAPLPKPPESPKPASQPPPPPGGPTGQTLNQGNYD